MIGLPTAWTSRNGGRGTEVRFEVIKLEIFSSPCATYVLVIHCDVSLATSRLRRSDDPATPGILLQFNATASAKSLPHVLFSHMNQ